MIAWAAVAVAAPLVLGPGTVDAAGCAATPARGTDSSPGRIDCDALAIRYDIGMLAGNGAGARSACDWRAMRTVPAGTLTACVTGHDLVATVTSTTPGRAYPANFYATVDDDAARDRVIAIAATWTPTIADRRIVYVPRGLELANAGVMRLHMTLEADPRELDVTAGRQVGHRVVFHGPAGEASTWTMGGLRVQDAWGPEAATPAGWWAEVVVFETSAPFADPWVTAPDYREIARFTVR